MSVSSCELKSSLLTALVITAYIPCGRAFWSNPSSLRLTNRASISVGKQCVSRAPAFRNLKTVHPSHSNLLLQRFTNRRAHGTGRLLSYIPQEQAEKMEVPVSDEANVRIVTYNVLSSSLADPLYYTSCRPKDLDPHVRYHRLLSKMVIFPPCPVHST